jgi:hypothetical protein
VVDEDFITERIGLVALRVDPMGGGRGVIFPDSHRSGKNRKMLWR